MDWKKEAMNDLRQYGHRMDSVQNIDAKIAELESRKNSIKAVMTDSDPVQGGGSVQEDRWTNIICEQERLEWLKDADKKLIARVDRALEKLTETERIVLDKFFIHRSKGHVEWLMEKLDCEKATVYRVKDRAMHNFTTAMYGLSEY